MLRRHPGTTALLALLVTVIVVRLGLDTLAPGLPWLAQFAAAGLAGALVGLLVERRLRGGDRAESA